MRVGRKKEDLWATLIVYATVGIGLIVAQIVALGPEVALRRADHGGAVVLADIAGVRP
ncbi:hypothetical protein M1105_13890 [Limibaculum sp. FT325]|uniref:hypothetical protein n=1 Tax=Thermohalobaculum sediminis TaxID=2939436 RepID=UPI0020BE98EA|nr:hypothetical protein [Limibaculum sediminis]MCL5778075.1 hypothetical protein [Limibaculum sediminis]